MNRSIKIFSRQRMWVIAYFILLGILSISGTYFIVNHAAWIFGDDHEWLVSTAAGISEPMSTHIGSGRFVPLGHYDFNWLTLLPEPPSPLVHYLWITFLFWIFIWSLGNLLFRITKLASPDNRAYLIFTGFVLMIFLIRPETVSLFMSVIYSERIVVVLLSLFMYFTFRVSQSDNFKDYIPALLSAVYVTYCKEPVFGIFVIVSLVNFTFNYNLLSSRQKLFNLLLLINSVVFVVLYYFIVFCNTSEFYHSAGTGTLPRFTMFLMLLDGIKIYYIIFILALYRSIAVVFFKDRKHLYYDGLLFASVGYFLAFVILQFYQSYYFYPGIVLALPAIVFFGIKMGHKKFVWVLLFSGVLLWSNQYNYDGLKLKICQYHQQRSVDQHLYEKIADKIKKGHKVYWYQTEPLLPENEVYKGILNWRKVISERFLNYLLHTSNQEYLPVITSFQKLEKGDILLYPVDNRIEKQENDDADKMIQYYDLSKIGIVGEISIYSHVPVEPIEIPATLDFTDHQNFLLNGFSYAEGQGRWTDGKQASIKFQLAEVPEKGMKLTFSGFPFLTENTEILKIKVKVNGKSKAKWVFEYGKPQPELQLLLSNHELSEMLVRLEFEINVPHSPQELGMGADNRQLGFHFRQVKMEKVL